MIVHAHSPRTSEIETKELRVQSQSELYSETWSGKERNEAPVFLSQWLGQTAEALGLESRRTVLLMLGRVLEDILFLHHSWWVDWE